MLCERDERLTIRRRRRRSTCHRPHRQRDRRRVQPCAQSAHRVRSDCCLAPPSPARRPSAPSFDRFALSPSIDLQLCKTKKNCNIRNKFVRITCNSNDISAAIRRRNWRIDVCVIFVIAELTYFATTTTHNVQRNKKDISHTHTIGTPNIDVARSAECNRVLNAASELYDRHCPQCVESTQRHSKRVG